MTTRNARWLALAGDMLELAAEEFSNHGCNDWELPAQWTLEQKRELVKAYYEAIGDPRAFDEDRVVIGDDRVMGLLACWLRGELAGEVAGQIENPPPHTGLNAHSCCVHDPKVRCCDNRPVTESSSESVAIDDERFEEWYRDYRHGQSLDFRRIVHDGWRGALNLVSAEREAAEVRAKEAEALLQFRWTGARAAAKQLDRALRDGCGDNSCPRKKDRGGMGTNGGCRCAELIEQALEQFTTTRTATLEARLALAAEQLEEAKSRSDLLYLDLMSVLAEEQRLSEQRDAEVTRLDALIQEMRQSAFRARNAANDAIWTIEEIGKNEADGFRHRASEQAQSKRDDPPAPLCPLSQCRHSLRGQHFEHPKGKYACSAVGCSCVISARTLAEDYPAIAEEFGVEVSDGS